MPPRRKDVSHLSDKKNQEPPEEIPNEDKDPLTFFSWKDILAFCLAIYRILIPQLLITLLVVLVFVLMLFWLWLN